MSNGDELWGHGRMVEGSCLSRMGFDCAGWREAHGAAPCVPAAAGWQAGKEREGLLWPGMRYLLFLLLVLSG